MGKETDQAGQSDHINDAVTAENGHRSKSNKAAEKGAQTARRKLPLRGDRVRSGAVVQNVRTVRSAAKVLSEITSDVRVRAAHVDDSHLTRSLNVNHGVKHVTAYKYGRK